MIQNTPKNPLKRYFGRDTAVKERDYPSFVLNKIVTKVKTGENILI